MKKTSKKKLCWHCDGQVELHLEHCPFCGVYLSPTSENEEEVKSGSLVPPYRFVNVEEETQVPAAPYQQNEESQPLIESPPDAKASKQKDQELKKVIFSLTGLLFGTAFFLFSMILFFFSNEGFLTLHWASHHWYIYALIGLPLLVFGWISFLQIQEHQHD
jgi:uncharacterized membrane protein YcjF (UPF0283 family)